MHRLFRCWGINHSNSAAGPCKAIPVNTELNEYNEVQQQQKTHCIESNHVIEAPLNIPWFQVRIRHKINIVGLLGNCS